MRVVKKLDHCTYSFFTVEEVGREASLLRHTGGKEVIFNYSFFFAKLYHTHPLSVLYSKLVVSPVN